MINQTFTADAKTDWEDWPGGAIQMSAIGSSFSGTLTLQITYDDVSGQTDATTAIDLSTLEANGQTADKLLIQGGKYRVVLSDSSSPNITVMAGVVQNAFYDRIFNTQLTASKTYSIGTDTGGFTV